MNWQDKEYMDERFSNIEDNQNLILSNQNEIMINLGIIASQDDEDEPLTPEEELAVEEGIAQIEADEVVSDAEVRKAIKDDNKEIL